MAVTGVVMTTFDVADDQQDAYRKRLVKVVEPELRASPGVAGASHYEAPPALQELRGINPQAEFAPGRSRFLQLVWLNVDDVAEVPVPPVRSSDALTLCHRETFALAWAQARAGCPLSEGARPFAVHQGVQIAFGEVADATMRPVVADWYRDVHAPDALAVDGFAIALRATSIESPARHLVVFLLDRPPMDAITGIRAAVPRWREQGRTPSPGGASRALFNGPFQRLT